MTKLLESMRSRNDDVIGYYIAYAFGRSSENGPLDLVFVCEVDSRGRKIPSAIGQIATFFG